MNDYQKRLEEFRLHYSLNYGLELDDEVLFFFIRVNEMQGDMKKLFTEMQVGVKKELDAIPRLIFRSGWDYFMFGMGKPSLACLIVSLAVAIAIIISPFKGSGSNVVIKNGSPYISVQVNDSVYYLPLKSGHDLK